MAHSQFNGIIPAFPTPLTHDGKIDVEPLGKIIDHMFAGGVGGVLPLGGTGEYASLSRDQRVVMVEATVSAAAGRGPVVAGVVAAGINDAIDMGKAFKDVGASAVMLIPPYYIKTNQQGLVDYFSYFKDKVDVPVLLYDIPSRDHLIILPETIALMAEKRLIVGMKASNTDLFLFDQLVGQLGPDFGLLAGQDVLFAQQVAQGATGGIITSAVVVPEIWVKVQKMAQANDFAGAIANQRLIYPLINALFRQENPGPLRSALEMIGIDSGVSLPPVPAVSGAVKDELFEAMARLHADGLLSVKPVMKRAM